MSKRQEFSTIKTQKSQRFFEEICDPIDGKEDWSSKKRNNVERIDRNKKDVKEWMSKLKR